MSDATGSEPCPVTGEPFVVVLIAVLYVIDSGQMCPRHRHSDTLITQQRSCYSS